MKKISLGVLALLTTLSFSASAFATGSIANNSLSIEENKEVSVSKNQYSYIYNDITFTGLSPLKENHLHSMYDSVMNHNKTSVIEGPGSSAEIIHGPEYKSYDHSYLRTTAKFVLSYLAVAIPAPIKKWEKAGLAFLLDTLGGWSQDALQDTHIGFWDWKVRDSDDKVDIYYVTVVRYKDNTFKKVIDVQYYEADRVRYK
ncbi:hypothetical protein ABE354_16260 [Brevibacillus laterosporus]|uniref:hypothetical protein n=1 Tax=Brevibacillus laterosporus TaxID=1465 RepID=UPI003D26182D